MGLWVVMHRGSVIMELCVGSNFVGSYFWFATIAWLVPSFIGNIGLVNLSLAAIIRVRFLHRHVFKERVLYSCSTVVLVSGVVNLKHAFWSGQKSISDTTYLG